MRRLVSTTLVVVIGLAVAQLPAARAQGAPPAQNASGTSYDTLIDNALNEYRLGHWIEAKAYFAQAHAIQPNARTLRGLGLVCYELRKYVEAIGYFQQALTNPTRPLTDTMREGVSQLLRDAERFVSRIELQLTPTDATLAIDGRPVQRDAEGRMLVDAGRHELTAEAPGYDSAIRSLTSDGGETIKLNVQLRSNQAVSETLPASATQPTAASSEDDSEVASSLPWIVVAASGVVMITGGVFLGISLSDKADIEDTKAGSRSWDEVESAYNRVPVFSTAGSIMLGVGAAGVVAGLAWKFWPKNSEQETATLRVSPSGVAVRVGF
jgi:hypothetical protein